MKNTVGKNIVKLRKEQGMSQEQLAQKLHVTRQARMRKPGLPSESVT